MAPLSTLIPETLPTPRLHLRLFRKTPAEYNTLIAFLNAPATKSAMGDVGVRDEATFNAKHDPLNIRPAVLTAHPNTEIDLYLIWLIHLPPSDPATGDDKGECIGLISLLQRGPTLPPDLGFIVTPTHGRKGYATEASRAVLAFARDVLGITAVFGFAALENDASRGVMRACGMAEVGGVSMVGRADEPGGPREKSVAAYVFPEEARGLVEGRRVMRGGE